MTVQSFPASQPVTGYEPGAAVLVLGAAVLPAGGAGLLREDGGLVAGWGGDVLAAGLVGDGAAEGVTDAVLRADGDA